MSLFVYISLFPLAKNSGSAPAFTLALELNRPLSFQTTFSPSLSGFLFCFSSLFFFFLFLSASPAPFLPSPFFFTHTLDEPREREPVCGRWVFGRGWCDFWRCGGWVTVVAWRQQLGQWVPALLR